MNIVPPEEDADTIAETIQRPALIPLVDLKDGCGDPAETYLKLREEFDSSYLLESLTGPADESRYSVIGCGSLLHLRIKDDEIEITGSSEAVEEARERADRARNADALEVLKQTMFLEDMEFLSMGLPRYLLGVTGYVGYDFVRSQADLKDTTEDDLEHATLEFMLPELVMVFDHLKDRTYSGSLVLLTEDTDFERVHSEALRKLEKFGPVKTQETETCQDEVSLDSNYSRKEFEKGVERIKEYIRAGDMIQTVLSRRIDLEPAPDLGDFYSELRRVNPSPYMFFLDFPKQAVVGSSPEALVRVTGETVMTRPIAGTRRRGEDEGDDREKEKDLLEDEKERAEHVMLVDLGRNDIGKVSEFGSVDATEFMEVGKYGHVQHIVSTVQGEMRDAADSFDALRSVFPAGTVTGAPKVRAMEIIEELEPTKRGIYSGAVGTFSYTGDADFAISIRTLTSDGEGAQIQAGAGIVADSVPGKEYEETQNKARSLLCAAGVSE